MPVYQLKNVSEFNKIGVWKITESETELSEQLINKGFVIKDKPNSPNKTRITQWLATRLLLTEFFDEVSINYTNLGKPYLNNGWFISISHSNEFVAINLNKNNDCGIDIEKITPKIERIKHKFLNPSDLQNVTSLEHLTLYWGAKEALYKYYGKKEVLFIENLFVTNFSSNKNNFIGSIELQNYSKKIDMKYEILEGHTLVYTL